MIEAGKIFQRTDNGREEIRQKSHGLTQSERRVLIMVDGVSSYAGLCEKMSALTEPRIARALDMLLRQNLVFEVLLPLEGQEAEQLDPDMIKNFLRQDPRDPFTIISNAAEEDFAEIEDLMAQGVPEIREIIQNRRPLPLSVVVEVETPPVPTPAPSASPVAGVGESAVVWCLPPKARPFVPDNHIPAAVARKVGAQWGYWAISLGLFLMGGSLFAKMLA